MTGLEIAFRYLLDNGCSPKAGDNIGKKVGSTAVGSLMADLRKRGCDIKCTNRGVNQVTGRQKNYYEMLSFPQGMFRKSNAA